VLAFLNSGCYLVSSILGKTHVSYVGLFTVKFMDKFKATIFSSLVLLCIVYLFNQLPLSKTGQTVAQPTHTSCQANTEWTRDSDNQWSSAAGISLILLPAAESASIPSVQFWDSGHASEAEAILELTDPGEEVNVTNYFWRVADPWRMEIPQPECPPNADCMPSPYSIYYLHRSSDEWVIDRLTIRAQGTVVSQPDPQAPSSRDIYVVRDGPYAPIFEGRFVDDSHTFWFSARYPETDRQLSTPEMRLATLQSINQLLRSCELLSAI
jgi:hypothetical protein